jgi:hypothetical protein
MLGQPNSEQHRFRLGILFLVIGLVLVLWAWGSWVYRMSVPEEPDRSGRESRISVMGPPASAAIAPIEPLGKRPVARLGESPRAPSLVPLTTMTIVLLLVLFFFGTLAVVVGTQRWRAMADRKRAVPTPNEDVWAMHKLPEDAAE